MTVKENLKNEILIKMKNHLGTTEMVILENVLNDTMYNKSVVEEETLPATLDNTNENIIELYQIKKSMTLSEDTMKEYLITVRDFLNYVHNKPLTKIETEDVNYYLFVKQKQGKSSLLNTAFFSKKSFIPLNGFEIKIF